ncbi:MAG: inositol monophosphatase [Thermoguttaceae bacterium]|nr:inositol monophosphatase [Thermoguttaceae bacterium]
MTSLDYLNVAVQAALEAGAILREKVGRIGFREKGRADLVTEADLAAQKKIAEIVLSKFPDHAFLGEESDGGNQLAEFECGSRSPKNHPFTWIVDPLDGTTNFVHQVPLFATSIGLSRGTELICGVIFNPMNNELFTAAKGHGVFLNGQPIRVSKITELEGALASISFPTQTTLESPDYLAFVRLVPHCQAMRRTGSTAINLAYLAAGRFDAVSCFAPHPWDVVAGVLMIQEAGGIVTQPDGSPFELSNPRLIAAATAELHQHYRETASR